MIAALLHGRTHLNFQEFRQQSHLTFFLHVLGVLELLQPHVFQSEHQGALWDCLLSFIRLLLVRGPDLLPERPFRGLGLGGGAPSGMGTGPGPRSCAPSSSPASARCPTIGNHFPFSSSPFCPHLTRTGGSVPFSARGRWVRADTGQGLFRAPGTPAGEQSPLACIEGRARLPALGTSCHPGEVPQLLKCLETPCPWKPSLGSGLLSLQLLYPC